MKTKRIIPLLTGLCCFLFSFSQQLRFETLNTSNGLSSNDVTCIYEDHEHFLWIGTRDGLNKFDGRIFKTFRNNPNDTNSLSGNFIVSIIQDAQHIFWIATKDGGLTRYDGNALSGKEFRQFKNNPKDNESIATNRLNCLYDWDETYLAVGAEAVPGIFVNKKTFRFTYWNYNTNNFHPNNALSKPLGRPTWIHYMVEANGKFYFSILNNGWVFEVDKQSGKMKMIQTPVSITRFFVAENKIWMSGWGSELYIQNREPDAPLEKLEGFKDELTSIMDLNRQYMLAGTRGSGLFLVNKTSRQISNFQKNIVEQSSIPSNKISCLYKDSRGTVWVGTLKGLAKYDTKTWLFTETEFTDVQYDGTTLYTHRFADGSVAVNTSKGMFLSDEFQMEFRNLHFANRGREIIPDCLLPMDDEYFLLGTEACFYSWKKGSNKLMEANIQRADFYKTGIFQVKEMIYDSVQGAHGAWMAVLGYGLAFYSFDDGSFYQYWQDNKNPKALGNSLARRIEKDKKGNIWIATASGLYMRSPSTRFSQNVFTAYVNDPGNPNSLPANDVTDVWCSRDNHVWVTTNGGGLAEFDGKKFTQYLPENSLSSKVFMGMHIDKRNRIWIITKNGLEVFDRSLKKFFHLDVNDASANANLSSYFSNETDGTVSFTAGNKLYSFKPDRIDFGADFPQLYLTDMNVFGKSFWTDVLRGVTHLNSRERYVNFTVSAVQFTSPQNVRFQYRLEPMEENWTNSDDGEIKYTNLPWGHYKLHVRVTNPAGQFGGEKILAEFVIATPFYYTWWFIGLCLAFIAALGYAFYRYRIAQLMKLQAIRNKIARDLHDDIGSTLGSISVFSEAAKQLLQQKNEERTRVMLGKIGDTSREMIDNMSDIVWSVNPKNDTAKHLVERMRVFAGDLVASSEIQLNFNSDAHAEDVKLTMEQRKNIFLIFKETVYNTIKYSGGKNLYIDIKRDHKNLLLTIKDDGTGFDVNNYKSKNGNGLKNMRHRAEEVGAKLEIESSAQGTVTSVII